MNPYIQNLKTYLATHPPNYGYPDANTLLDMLYCCYSEYNPLDNRAINDGFKKLNHFLDRFTVQECDPVLDTLSDLCQQHEHVAFNAGVQVGIRLAAELHIE